MDNKQFNEQRYRRKKSKYRSSLGIQSPHLLAAELRGRWGFLLDLSK